MLCARVAHMFTMPYMSGWMHEKEAFFWNTLIMQEEELRQIIITTAINGKISLAASATG